jgi:hypothetical protein
MSIKKVTGLEKCYGYIYELLVVLGVRLQDNVGGMFTATCNNAN